MTHVALTRIEALLNRFAESTPKINEKPNFINFCAVGRTRPTTQYTNHSKTRIENYSSISLITVLYYHQIWWARSIGELC